MSLSFQEFTTRTNYVLLKIGVHEIQAFSPNKALESRFDELTSLVKQLEVGKSQTKMLYGIFTFPEHPINSCSTLQEDSIINLPQAYATNIYNPQSNKHNRYKNLDLVTNRYHPN